MYKNVVYKYILVALKFLEGRMISSDSFCPNNSMSLNILLNQFTYQARKRIQRWLPLPNSYTHSNSRGTFRISLSARL